MARKKLATLEGSDGKRILDDVLAEQVAKDQIVPALKPWEKADLELRQAVKALSENALRFAAIATKIVDEKLYEKFGFVDHVDYFQDRIGMAYTTVARYLRAYRPLKELPEDERAETMALLADVGINKAAILSPLLEKAESQKARRAIIEKAADATATALQANVSAERGLRPTGEPESAPGERFYAFLRNNIPPDERETLDRVFIGCTKKYEIRHKVAIFLWLMKLGIEDLAAQGYDIDA